jgi:hypothetical protein
VSARTPISQCLRLLACAVVAALGIPLLGCGAASQNSVSDLANAPSSDTLQHCIGFAAGQPWPNPAGPKPETMSFCEQLPAWKSYDQARQTFQAQDHAAAARLLLVAAGAGNPLAALRLAIMYDNGDALDLNKKEAFRWYLNAARAGEPGAQDETGSFYEDGAVVPEDWIAAAKWYAQSAQFGWANGQFDLGRAYEYGIGVPLNLDTALDWYTRAGSQGNARARQTATYLRQNHGVDASSLNGEEQAVYSSEDPGLRLLSHTVPPPVGHVFQNKAERLTFIRVGIRRVLWREYDACVNAVSVANRRCYPPSVPRPTGG